MTIDDWPILCQHKECSGTATPATWLYDDGEPYPEYLCNRHMQKAYNKGFNDPDWWVKLTPNQRPSYIQEAHIGND